MIEVYGRDNCQYCTKAVNLLELKKMEYTYYKLGIDLTLDELLEKFPDAKTVPIVVANGFRIGGFTELETYLVEQQDTLRNNDLDF